MKKKNFSMNKGIWPNSKTGSAAEVKCGSKNKPAQTIAMTKIFTQGKSLRRWPPAKTGAKYRKVSKPQGSIRYHIWGLSRERPNRIGTSANADIIAMIRLYRFTNRIRFGISWSVTR